jgi:hypothetical protein
MISGLLKNCTDGGRIEKLLKSNENENTAYQNLLDTAKAVLRRKFIAMSAKI